MKKNSEFSEDDLKVAEDKVQKITDEKIENIDTIISDKEKEIMEV